MECEHHKGTELVPILFPATTCPTCGAVTAAVSHYQCPMAPGCDHIYDASGEQIDTPPTPPAPPVEPPVALSDEPPVEPPVAA